MIATRIAAVLMVALAAVVGAAPARADDCSETDLRAAVAARAAGTRSLVKAPRVRMGRGYPRPGFHSAAAPLYGPFLRDGCAAVVISSQWLSIHPNRQTEDVHFDPTIVIGHDVWELRRGRLRRVSGGNLVLGPAEAQLGGPIATQGRDADGNGRLDVCFGTRCFAVGRTSVTLITAPAQGQPQPNPTPMPPALPGETRHAGRITNIVVGQYGAHTIALSDGAQLPLTLASPLPFVVGDNVSVRMLVTSIGIHRVVSATITRPDGTLLVGIAGGGDNQWAPGFVVEQGPVMDRSQSSPRHGERREHGLVVRHLNQRVTVRPNQPGTLRASDGSFTIVGHAISYGPGMRVPDSSEYTMFAIQRVP